MPKKPWGVQFAVPEEKMVEAVKEVLMTDPFLTPEIFEAERRARMEGKLDRIAELQQLLADSQRRFHELAAVRLEMCEAKDARIAELEAALREIAKVGYGLDGTETDEEMGEYWAQKAVRYQNIARKALRGEETT